MDKKRSNTEHMKLQFTLEMAKDSSLPHDSLHRDERNNRRIPQKTLKRMMPVATVNCPCQENTSSTS